MIVASDPTTTLNQLVCEAAALKTANLRLFERSFPNGNKVVLVGAFRTWDGLEESDGTFEHRFAGRRILFVKFQIWVNNRLKD